MPDCELLTETEELEALVPEWIELCEADSQATPFQRPEWLLPWWRQFGAAGDLRVAVVRNAGALRAVLPFYRYREPATGQEQLQLLGVGTTDYLDGVFVARCGQEEVRAGVARLAQAEWEVLHGSQLREGSPLRQCLLAMGAETYASESCTRGPALRVEQLPGKLRRNVMYYRNVAQRRGQLQLCVAEASQTEEALEEFIRLHTARWTSVGQPGVMADERVVRWHREAAPLLQQAGLLRLCRLRLGDTTLAMMYALADPTGRPERTCFCYLPAFAAEARKLRPGTLLLACVHEAMLDEGVGTIDLLRGDEPYKQHWQVATVATTGVVLRRAALLVRSGGASL